MKSVLCDEGDRMRVVAPHWGAWIEITCASCLRKHRRKSHPTGVRGLKYGEPVCVECKDTVAPHWGAWIEMIG